MAQMFEWMSNEGEKFKLSCVWTRAGEKLFLERTGELPSGMRVGHYSVGFGSGFVLIARVHPQHLLDDPQIGLTKRNRHSKWNADYGSDRVRQLREARKLIKGHPLEKEVLEDIKREEKFWN